MLVRGMAVYRLFRRIHIHMARDKTCSPADLPAELPLLSNEEEKLVEAVCAGHDNSAAYKMAYGAEGYSPASLKVRACRKIAEPKIQAHLRALRGVGLANIRLTAEQRLKDEIAFAQRAEDAGNWGAAGGAQDRVNKLLGLYVEKHQDVTATHDPVQTINEMAEVMGPEFAAAKAKEYGIPWQPPGAEASTRH